jgi:hypothetical protein
VTLGSRSFLAIALLPSLLGLAACGGGTGAPPRSATPTGTAAAAPRSRFASWETFTSAYGSFSIAMPAPTRERRASEGPVTMRLVSSKDEQGTTYEATYFDMPTSLEPPERKELLDKIQVGLTGGPGVRLLDRRDVVTDGVSGRQLVLGLPKQHAGTWRIFYVGQRRMFQLSVVGLEGRERDAAAAAFFDSFKLKNIEETSAQSDRR